MFELLDLHNRAIEMAQKYTIQCQQDDSENTEEALKAKVNWLNAEIDFNEELIKHA